jgi:hypothetical protein
MKNMTPYLPSSGIGNMRPRALRGVSVHAEVRFVAPITDSLTGEVRPQAGNAWVTSHLDGGVKDGVRVRVWSPPV